jgi:hypothetical protein
LLPKRKDPGYEDGDVFEKLSKLNPRKAHGPDGIPTWVLKENADILELPVKEILNCSYRECRVPKSWKEADIVAIPRTQVPSMP